MNLASLLCDYWKFTFLFYLSYRGDVPCFLSMPEEQFIYRKSCGSQNSCSKNRAKCLKKKYFYNRTSAFNNSTEI